MHSKAKDISCFRNVTGWSCVRLIDVFITEPYETYERADNHSFEYGFMGVLLHVTIFNGARL